MSYIDAGYAIALSVLAAYLVVLWRRHHRLERLAASVVSSEPSRYADAPASAASPASAGSPGPAGVPVPADPRGVIDPRPDDSGPDTAQRLDRAHRPVGSDERTANPGALRGST